MSFYRGSIAQKAAIVPNETPNIDIPFPYCPFKVRPSLNRFFSLLKFLPLKQIPIKLVLLLLVGIVAYSFGAIFIRQATVAEGINAPGFILVLSASRLAIASLFWLPAWRGFAAAQYSLKTLQCSMVAGVGLAAYLACWMISLSYTSITISTALSNTQPILAIFLAWWWFRDKPQQEALVGTAIALAGSLIISAGPSSLNSPYPMAWLGNSLALVGAIANCFYLMLGHQAHDSGMKIQHHAALAYSTAALILIPIALQSGYFHFGYSKMTYICILMLAIVPQLIGHNCLNWAMRSIKPQLLTLLLLSEPIIAGLLGYWIFGETPATGVLVGAIILLTGVATVVLSPKPTEPCPSA